MPNFLTFTFKQMTDSGKTAVWSVTNTLSGMLLGSVKWRGAWKKYVFETTTTATAFDSGCLREIAGFLDDRTEQHNTPSVLC